VSLKEPRTNINMGLNNLYEYKTQESDGIRHLGMLLIRNCTQRRTMTRCISGVGVTRQTCRQHGMAVISVLPGLSIRTIVYVTDPHHHNRSHCYLRGRGTVSLFSSRISEFLCRQLQVPVSKVTTSRECVIFPKHEWLDPVRKYRGLQK
jgi:hypothetical protein